MGLYNQENSGCTTKAACDGIAYWASGQPFDKDEVKQIVDKALRTRALASRDASRQDTCRRLFSTTAGLLYMLTCIFDMLFCLFLYARGNLPVPPPREQQAGAA